MGEEDWQKDSKSYKLGAEQPARAMILPEKRGTLRLLFKNLFYGMTGEEQTRRGIGVLYGGVTEIHKPTTAHRRTILGYYPENLADVETLMLNPASAILGSSWRSEPEKVLIPLDFLYAPITTAIWKAALGIERLLDGER